MNKLVLPTYGAHLPEVPECIRKPTWVVPPSLYTPRGFELDISPLLMVDRLVLDSYAYEYIVNECHHFLEPLQEMIPVLLDEGFIELADFGGLTKPHKEDVARQTQKAVEHVLDWRPQLAHFADWWAACQADLRQAMGQAYEPTVPVILGIYAYLMQARGKVEQSEVERLAKLIRSKKKKWKKTELEELQAIVSPYLSYVHLNLALSEIVGHPLLDWQGMERFYQAKYDSTLRSVNPKMTRQQQLLLRARQLFTVALPGLRPSTPQQAITLLTDKRVRDVRQMLEEAVGEGRTLTESWGQEALIAAQQAQIKLEKKRTVTGWVARAVSFIPLMSGPAIAGEELADAVHRRTTKKYRWLYALIEATSAGLADKQGRRCRR